MISQNLYTKALRESNKLGKLIDIAIKEIDDGVVKTYDLRQQGPVRLNRTKAGILLPESSSWVAGFVNRKTGIAQFSEAFQELSAELLLCKQYNLTMMGLRSLYDLFDKQLATLFYAPEAEVERVLARYHFLSAVVTNAPISKKMAQFIKNRYPKDAVIQKFNMADFGKPEFIKLASNNLARSTFGDSFSQYSTADKQLMENLKPLLHGYVHANPFSFRATKLRNDPANNLLSLKELKLAALLMLRYEVLWGLSKYANIQNSSKLFKRVEQVMISYRTALGLHLAGA